VGEARFLVKSLHPEVAQVLGTADEEPSTSFELVECKKEGDTAHVDVALASDDGQKRRERHTVKSVKGRWLFAAATQS
jgi:hypothetical protein